MIAADIKKDCPIFSRKFNGKPLVYLDNGATTQKPQQVIDAITDYYRNHNANVHRGIYTLSEEATQLYDDARAAVAKFINAPSSDEIIFTKGATESLNRTASGWAEKNLKAGDIILTTDAEHHSNLIPWQTAAKKTGATLEFLEVDEAGEISVEQARAKITGKVKLVAMAHASNVLGTVFPVEEICQLAQKAGAKTVIDGAKAAPHLPLNMQKLGCDFYAFSSHKMLGPMGIGVLWAKKSLLDRMEPYEYGGGTVSTLNREGDAVWAEGPNKFEAGTPNVAGAVGLAAAIKYLQTVGMDKIQAHGRMLAEYAYNKLSKINGLKIFGPAEATKRVGLVSFSLEGIHPHDIATVLNTHGVAVRAGQHCAMPLHKKLGVPATTRASFYLYNTKADIDALTDGIKEAVKILG